MTLYDLGLTTTLVRERQQRYEAEAARGRLLRTAETQAREATVVPQAQMQPWQLSQAPALACCEAV